MPKPPEWSEPDKEYLRQHYPNTDNATLSEYFGRSVPAVKMAAKKQGLRKSREHLSCAGRFESGAAPWNKGTSYNAGGRSTLSRFKKGQKPHNTNPIGHERVSADDILQRKVTDTGNTNRDYVAVHKLIWEEHNGPVPAGHIVVFKDRNRRNFDPANLECISRGENAKRNSIHRYPKELVSLIRVQSNLKRKINQRVDHEKQT